MFTWKTTLVTVGFLLLAATACKKATEPGSNATNQSHPVLSREEAKEQRRVWNLKTLVEAYEHAGHTNPKWDEPAKRALNEFARARSQLTESNEPWSKIIATNCEFAVKAGCDDPMIAYLHTRWFLDQTNSPKVFAEAFAAAADQLHESSYPDIRKFYASYRAAEQIHRAIGGGTNLPPEAHKYRRHAMSFLASAVREKTMPIGEVDEACDSLFETLKRNDTEFADFYRSIEQPLFSNWPDESVVWWLKGRAYIEMAWHARGGDYANKVTDKGWKLFKERLAIAEESLNHAWKLNPEDPRIAVKMMWVELGQGEGRDRMELWFSRAMELDPNDYDACSAKCLYLEPKWYGSIKEMLSFGRECVQNKKWGGRVPLILVDTHWDIPLYYLDGLEKINYWTQPQVWPDIKAAYDRFFELNPDATGYYHNYALYAYRAEQWDKLNELIPKLGPVNYSFFGGKEEFDKMVLLAKQHGNKPN